MTMSIKEFMEKSKGFIEKDRDIFITIIIVLVAFGSFGLGRLSKAEDLETSVSIKNMSAFVLEAKTESKLSSNKESLFPSPQAGGFYVGSKNGSKYHFPWCGGAKRIKEGNKVIFDTIEQAREAGYTPAGNCKGLR